MFKIGDKVIYDGIYRVRFEGPARDAHGRIDPVLAVVYEDGYHFFARYDMLSRPTPAIKGNAA